MKRLVSLLVAAIVFLGAAAQNEHIHIYRNDKAFKTHKASEVSGISFDGNATAGSNNMIVTDLSGKTYTYPMSKVDSCVVRTTGVPEVHVTLNDYPTWTELQGSKDDIHPAQLHMLGNGMYDDLDEQTVEFRGRGNSTWNMKKKPYRFKMEKKKAVCGMAKAKTYALLANYIDCTLMRNAIAMWIGRYLELPFTNHMVPVKVYLNGVDKGQYVMTEKIGIGGGSVDIDETKGMLFELDTNYDETYKFKFYWGSKWIPVMVKDPDLDELAADPEVTNITNAQAYFELWKQDFTAMATALTSRSASESLKDVIDLDQAVNFVLVNAIANNHEMQHPKSMYVYKEELGSGAVYKFGPVWDFDWAFTYNGKEGATATVQLVTVNGKSYGYDFFKYLLQNKEFKARFKAKFDDFVTNGYPELKKFIDEYADLIEPTAKENGLYWPSSSSSTSSYEFRSNLQTLKTWLDTRIKYMQTEVNYGLYK